MSDIIIIRILGNDLKMHDDNQTYNNLKFTLENEHNFNNTDKLYILNKIINTKKKNQLIALLEKHMTKYIDIPIDKDNIRQLKYDYNWNYIEKSFFSNTISKKTIGNKRKEIHNQLYIFNQHIINNNGIRNYAIDYGKKHSYTWTFVLDSNNFILIDDFNTIMRNLKCDTEYIILPTKRLTDNDLQNTNIFDKNMISKLPHQEPQIAFKNTSTVKYNPDIPYGASPKVELLQVLKIKGKWDDWKDYYKWYGIKPRHPINAKCQILSQIIRLKSSDKFTNNTTDNWFNRIVGLYILIKDI